MFTYSREQGGTATKAVKALPTNGIPVRAASYSCTLASESPSSAQRRNRTPHSPPSWVYRLYELFGFDGFVSTPTDSYGSHRFTSIRIRTSRVYIQRPDGRQLLVLQYHKHYLAPSHDIMLCVLMKQPASTPEGIISSACRTWPSIQPRFRLLAPRFFAHSPCTVQTDNAGEHEHHCTPCPLPNNVSYPRSTPTVCPVETRPRTSALQTADGRLRPSFESHARVASEAKRSDISGACFRLGRLKNENRSFLTSSISTTSSPHGCGQ